MMHHTEIGLAWIIVTGLWISLAWAAGAVAQTSAPAIPAALDAQRIEQVAGMLPPQPRGLGEPISNRPAWEALARTPAGQDILSRAEKLLTKPLPPITDELYLDFSKTGNRNRWQAVAFDRRGRVGLLAMAECLENKGRFLPALQTLIVSLCQEKCWTLSAHDRKLTNFNGTRIDIDLGSSALAWRLANADWLVGEKLDAALRQRMRDLIHQRVLDPFRDMYTQRRPLDGWMTASHNWNAVCLAGVTATALIEIPSPQERAEYVVAAEYYSQNFLSGFVGGYCTEGLGYWNYGFGHYLMLSEIIRRATGGQIDLLQRPEVIAPAGFGRGIQIINDVAPAFADCSPTAKPDAKILWFLGTRLNIGLPQDRKMDLKQAAAETGWGTGGITWALIVGFPDSAFALAPANQPLGQMPVRTWFDQAGILIGRPRPGSGCKMGVALKGGNNNEAHNHNDVGSYVVVLDNVAVLLDPGGENYTARTFGPQRYDSKLLNSFGHAVPIVAGQLQRTGAHAEARILASEFTDAQDTLEMDIGSAYDVPELRKLVRKFVYSRQGQGRLQVSDTVELASPQSFGTALITAGKATQQPDGSILIEDHGQAVRVTIDTDGQPWTLHQEQINEQAQSHPFHVGIDLDRPVTGATITVTIEPAVEKTASTAATKPASTAQVPETYLLDGYALLRTRQRATSGDPALAPLIEMLRRKADAELKRPLWSIVDKPFAGPSGDKHDYVSLSPYFWPDPSKPDGLPYISRDGEYNPEVRQYDRTRMDGMADGVYTLSLAYYLTGQESYGHRAAQQMRTWFMEESTRMNPNLKYTSMIKGKNEGSFWGVLNTEILRKVVDAEPLLAGSPFWSADDHAALRKWFVEYMDWLRNGEMGKKEDKMTNNHGTLYDMQTADFALFTGDRKLANQILDGTKTKRIATQIEPDGSMPKELSRTRSLSYSLLNLVAMAQVARLGEHVDVDLWNYRTPDGRGIRTAVDWMLPYATGQKSWPNKQITRITYGEFVFVLRLAAKAYNDPSYEQAIGKLKTDERVQNEVLWINLIDPATQTER